MDYLKISVQSPDHKKLFELLRTLYQAVELVRDLCEMLHFSLETVSTIFTNSTIPEWEQ